MTSDVVVEVAHLVKDYGAARAVDDVSFSVRRGRTLALVGESGAGKTTVGAIVTGLVAATSGRVLVCGEDRTRAARRTRDRRRRARQLQVVPQDPATSLDPTQPVGSALREAIRAAGDPSAPTVEQLLDSVGMQAQLARAVPRDLSGGQRQRVAIARALAARPDVIVLDEAVSALDVSVQAQVLNILTDLQREHGTAYLFITHDLAVVRQVADDVVVLKDGVVVEHCTADDLFAHAAHDYTRTLLESTPRRGWRPGRVSDSRAPA